MYCLMLMESNWLTRAVFPVTETTTVPSLVFGGLAAVGAWTTTGAQPARNSTAAMSA
jgi:hypothetical protein